MGNSLDLHGFSSIRFDRKISPNYKEGPAAKHTLVYDSAVETLEPVYFL